MKKARWAEASDGGGRTQSMESWELPEKVEGGSTFATQNMRLQLGGGAFASH